jgi:hypothetical protein
VIHEALHGTQLPRGVTCHTQVTPVVMGHAQTTRKVTCDMPGITRPSGVTEVTLRCQVTSLTPEVMCDTQVTHRVTGDTQVTPEIAADA